MREKRYFKNLPDSIFLTVVFFMMLLLGSGTAVYTALYESIDVFLGVTLLWCCIFIIPLALSIVFACYEYWYLKNDTLFCKKLFRKIKSIRLNDIVKAEKKTVVVVAAACGGKYRNAYVIYGNSEKITLVINKKNEQYLNGIFEKYVKCSTAFRK